MHETKLFSSLNILYLKMFQYEKFLEKSESDKIFDFLNLEIKKITKECEEKYCLTNIPFSSMLKYCVFNPDFNKNISEFEAKKCLKCDLENILMIKGEKLENLEINKILDFRNKTN